MDNDFSETVRILQKFVADPEQIFLVLFGKRNAWSDASMHKKIVAARERYLQLVQELEMRVRHGLIECGRERGELFCRRVERSHHAVRHQRVKTAILTP